MINILQAQANQTTRNGSNEDWVVTLNDEQLYKLPAHFSVEETFTIKDIVHKMMLRAADEMRKQEQQLSLIKIQKVVSNGDAQLDALRRENERLAEILQQHIEVA